MHLLQENNGYHFSYVDIFAGKAGDSVYQQQIKIINAFRMLIDSFSILTAGYVALYTMNTWFPKELNISSAESVAAVLAIMVANNYIMNRFRLYCDSKPSSSFETIWAIAKTIVVDFALLSAGMLFIKGSYCCNFFVFFLGYCFVFLSLERVLFRFYYTNPFKRRINLRKVLVVGDLQRGRLVTEILKRQISWGHEIVGHYIIDRKGCSPASLDTPEEFCKIIHKQPIDEVIFALDADPSIDLGGYLKKCRQMGITTRVVPASWSPSDRHIHFESCQGAPFLTFQENNFNATGLLYKRVLDILGGIAGILIFTIITPFVAMAIKRDSPGPVIFKQKRVGQHGRIFEVYKYRTMYMNAESQKEDLMERNEMKGAMFKINDDPRITRVGKWLRKTSVDEIPQFINVLKGEMSLVGTRPPTVDEVELYKDWHFRRISAKPGITGLWQVSGRNEITDFDEIVELDTRYLENWRFLDDISILFKTVLVVVRGRGAV